MKLLKKYFYTKLAVIFFFFFLLFLTKKSLFFNYKAYTHRTILYASHFLYGRLKFDSTIKKRPFKILNPTKNVSINIMILKYSFVKNYSLLAQLS
jgi:hypothetical protein